ncbi:ribosome maturation factor RimP [Aliicoccus persicus]|uniref:Ribosome maturation factor RimP n=1 Tax=Aliicoccus persicus TaxID=930138 RepID=A0A662Z3W2_9STAP|nr:ribosome maturation factor RimP [Aliicoccus persicus]SEV81852.1 ribosome maturation factor RimP [Aliicoccus persicus]
MNQIEQNIADHVKPEFETLGYLLVDVEYKKEGKDFFLRLFIDKNGGVTIEDCVRASEAISEKLDEWDLISGAYFLDVSSPGAERPIKTEEDLQTTLNNGIYVKTYQQIGSEKEWTGVLTGYDEDTVTIEYKDKARKKTITIDRDKIATIRKAVLL